jgi:hypothetical protein
MLPRYSRICDKNVNDVVWNRRRTWCGVGRCGPHVGGQRHDDGIQEPGWRRTPWTSLLCTVPGPLKAKPYGRRLRRRP